MVNTREEAQRAVECSKYPPLGTRSLGGAFAPYAFGLSDWPTYARVANDQILVTVQIESAVALQNLEEILSVPGIDVAFVGPNDLHAQLGLTPSTEKNAPVTVAPRTRCGSPCPVRFMLDTSNAAAPLNTPLPLVTSR